MRVTVTRPLVHRCPYVDEIDKGTVEASWEGDSVELHAFAGHLDSFRNLQATHEDITEEVRIYLNGHGAQNIVVTTRWQTAGMDVKVTA